MPLAPRPPGTPPPCVPLKLGGPSTLLSGTATPGAFTVARDGHVLLAKLVPAAQGQRSRAELVQNWVLLLTQR